jgi:hypothetical protein
MSRGPASPEDADQATNGIPSGPSRSITVRASFDPALSQLLIEVEDDGPHSFTPIVRVRAESVDAHARTSAGRLASMRSETLTSSPPDEVNIGSV